jgi:hypothetical protein
VDCLRLLKACCRRLLCYCCSMCCRGIQHLHTSNNAHSRVECVNPS